MAGWIDVLQRVVPGVRIEIPCLRILWVGEDERGIRRRKPALRRRVVPGPEVIEAGFGVPFFAGELVPRFVRYPVAGGPSAHPR